MQPDFAIARELLRWFDDPQLFQPFKPDRSEEHSHIRGPLEHRWRHLAQLVAEGWSIGFAVNTFRSGSRHTTNDDVIGVRGVWLSADHARFHGCNLPPTFRVQTSPGRYWYCWVVSGEWNTDVRTEQGRQGRKEFDQVQRTIAKLYDGEAKAISQKLRMPGTLNYNHGTPWLVTYELVSGATYTREEILIQFPPMPQPDKPERTTSVRDGDDMDVLGWAAGQLDEIDPDLARNDWLGTLSALKSLGEIGYELAREWSEKGTKFQIQQPFDTDWKSCKIGELSELRNIARKFRSPVPCQPDRPVTWIDTDRKPDDLVFCH